MRNLDNGNELIADDITRKCIHLSNRKPYNSKHVNRSKKRQVKQMKRERKEKKKAVHLASTKTRASPA